VNNTLTLLGLLSKEPSYGYDLKHSYDRYFGTQKALAFGQVYSTLARMVRDELIRALGEETGGGPDRKKYEVTPSGKPGSGSGCSRRMFRPRRCRASCSPRQSSPC